MGQIQHGALPGTIADVHAAEVASLMPLGRPFDGFVEHTKRVSPTCLVHFERNRYSVPASFANRPVSLRIYPERIVVAAEGQILCEHAPDHRPFPSTCQGATVYDWRHYLAVIQRKPGALRNGAPFAELPEPSGRCSSRFSRRPAATERWSRSWPSFSSMTSRRCCAPSNWRLRRASPPKPMSSTCCTG